MTSTENPDPLRERFNLLRTVIDSLKQMKDHSDKIAPTVRDTEEIHLTSLNLVADAWLSVLEDELILKGFEEDVDKQVADPAYHWVTIKNLQRVEFFVGEINEILKTVKGLSSADQYVDLLAKELKTVIRAAAQYPPAGQREEIHKRQLSNAANLLRESESAKNIHKIEANATQALERTEAIASKASEAAGSTGESMMAQHYQVLADNESKTARRFRFWTIVSTVFGGITAAVFVLGPTLGWAAANIESGDWIHLVQRAIVTAAVFAFSAYLARQAHQHRMMANWASSLAVQLKTFEAFLAPITSEDVRDRLRTSFATRVFGEHPVLKGEPSGTGTADVAEKALDVLAKNSAK